jgi:hypothetical protein
VSIIVGGTVKAASSSFLEKRTKKLLLIMAFALPQRARPRIKVFASFFKKKRFLPMLTLRGISEWPRACG